MDIVEAFQRLGAAFAVGLLVGMERGWQERDVRPGGRTAGVRTFAISGLLGGLAGYLNILIGPALPVTLLLLFGLAFVLFKRREASDEENYSVTGIVAALVVFALGTSAVVGEPAVAAAGGVVTAGLLAARNKLHGFLRQLTWVELRSALVLLAMTLVALPLLPDRTVDPWDALNPFALWLMTVMIAAISYAGYIAVRLAGPSRGILFAGAAGGLVSSTALTLSFAHFATDAPESARRLAAGATVAGALSLGRALAIAGALAPPLLMPMATTMIPAILALLGASVLMIGRTGKGRDHPQLELKNPFDLGTVLRFGALLGAVTWLSKVLVDAVGPSTLYLVAAISGLVDIDAITLSTARLTGRTLDETTALTTILIAVTVNLLTKVALAAFIDRAGRFSRSLAISTLACVVAGVAAYVVLLPLITEAPQA